jgi:outer membrane protein assembly factor BamE (lipoprotein component of BamABCDE complex)
MRTPQIIATTFLVLLVGCTSPPKETIEKNNLTAGQVSLTLKKNTTTQQQVVEAFGSPNLVTQHADGEEVWTYQRHATVSNASSSGFSATIILLGGGSSSSGFEQSSRTITLIIKFKEVNGVKTVVDFSSRSSSF